MLLFFLLENYVSKPHSSVLTAIGQLIFFLICFAAVLVMAYFSAKYIAKTRMGAISGKNVSIVESINLGISAALYLIKAGEQYFLISVSKDGIRLISEIAAKDIKAVESSEPMLFENIMKEYLDKFGKHKK